MENITIENIIATSSIADELDLSRLASAIQGSQYEPSDFPGLVIKFTEPRKIAVILFSNGNIVCTGAKDKNEILDSIQKIKKEIHDEISNFKDSPEITIQNIVASIKLQTNIQLSDVIKILPSENIEYNPEKFPGVVYRLDEMNIVILIFESGKIVCAGAKTLEEVTTAFQNIKKALSSLGIS